MQLSLRIKRLIIPEEAIRDVCFLVGLHAPQASKSAVRYHHLRQPRAKVKICWCKAVRHANTGDKSQLRLEALLWSSETNQYEAFALADFQAVRVCNSLAT